MSGMPIDEALIAAVKGAIPGGPLAQAAFSITAAAVQGKNIIEAGLSEAAAQLHLPPEAASALNVAAKAAQGENIGTAALEEARKYLPAGPAQQAFDIGVSIGQGKKLQDVLVKQVVSFGSSQLNTIADIGSQAVDKIPAFKAAQQLVDNNPDAQLGYKLGIGLLSNTGFNSQVTAAIRAKLNPPQTKGFDQAMATHVGAVIGPPPPVALSTTAKAAYYVTQGMVGGTPKVNATIMQSIVTNAPQAREGAAVAVVQISNARTSNASFITYLLHLLHLDRLAA
jgi:hypothetical protein